MEETRSILGSNLTLRLMRKAGPERTQDGEAEARYLEQVEYVPSLKSSTKHAPSYGKGGLVRARMLIIEVDLVSHMWLLELLSESSSACECVEDDIIDVIPIRNLNHVRHYTFRISECRIFDKPRYPALLSVAHNVRTEQSTPSKKRDCDIPRLPTSPRLSGKP